MYLIKWCIEHPVSTIVSVLLVALFGSVTMVKLPIQMMPTVDKPVIRIQTIYPGAAPPEVEEQVTDKFEEKINSVEGLRKLSSTSSDSLSEISMEFDWGVNRDARFIDVLQKTNQVESYPEEAEKPIIAAVATTDEDRIMWIMLQSDTMSVEEMSHFAKKEIKDALERVEGVGDAGIYGKREREIAVILDPEALVARSLTVQMVRDAILRENRNVRGGYIDEGKTRFNIRSIGLFETIAQMKRMVVSRTATGTVYLEEIAEIKDSYQRLIETVRGNSEPMIAIGIARKEGANVIEITRELDKVIENLNKRFSSILYQGRPASMILKVAYRQSEYIWDSLNFMIKNIWMGSLLAVVVLIIFLKSFSATFVVAMVIPICFISIFPFLQFLDRTINIISLAGIAFAVGMTVDNAIVVVENIYRYMEMGKDRKTAALEGASEVWGAILASTLTTIAVFLPIVYVKEEAGELFKDIALAISFSVFMSLVLSITLIPMLAARMLKISSHQKSTLKILPILFWIPDILGKFFSKFLLSLHSFLIAQKGKKSFFSLLRSLSTKVAIVILITVSSLWIANAFQPPLEYLPTGNQNMLLVIFKLHTGTNIYKGTDVCVTMEKKIIPMLFDESKGDNPENRPVDHMFAVTAPNVNVIGVIIKKHYAQIPIKFLPMKINPMTGSPFLSTMDYLAFRVAMLTYGTPGTEYAFAIKVGLFRFDGKNFEIEVRGPEIKNLQEIAGKLETSLKELAAKAGFDSVRSNFEVGLPEIRVEVDREKAASFGLKTSEIAEIIEVLIAGKKTGKFRDGSEEIDIVVKGNDNLISDTEKLKKISFVVPGIGTTNLESLAKIHFSTGPTQIFHKERQRAITITVNLPEDKPLEEAIMQCEPLLQEVRKTLPADYHIAIAGTASDLERTKTAFFASFWLSIIVNYLLMCSLFESFFYPFIIMFTVPLAISGSILAVYWNNVPLDMLTVLGFIILCGIVVNNAILVVHQALNFWKEKQDGYEAILLSVQSRLRPIFMSTITTIFGILPMCIKGSPGSELYSGLATAIVGGLLFSTFFTLILTPILMATLIDIRFLLAKFKISK